MKIMCLTEIINFIDAHFNHFTTKMLLKKVAYRPCSTSLEENTIQRIG